MTSHNEEVTTLAIRLAALMCVSLRYANFPFTGFDGNRYGSGGIRAMKRRLAQLKGQTTTDQEGVKAVRDELNKLIKDKEDALNDWELLLKTGKTS
jgi:hypothetical protein